jgi:hypothetical protein
MTLEHEEQARTHRQRVAETGAWDRTDATRDDLLSLLEGLRCSVEVLAERLDLSGRIERHPGKALVLALAAGYIVGGGLLTRLTARLLWAGVRIGGRMATVPFVRNEIWNLVDSMAAKNEPERSD